MMYILKYDDDEDDDDGDYVYDYGDDNKDDNDSYACIIFIFILIIIRGRDLWKYLTLVADLTPIWGGKCFQSSSSIYYIYLSIYISINISL